MKNKIFKPNKEQITSTSVFVAGSRFKVMSEESSSYFKCKVWGHLDSVRNGVITIPTSDILNMELICKIP